MKIASKNLVKMIDVHDVRDINQTIFLHLIRERQPLSRAEIAKFMGLRAGTVSAIVNRLIKNNFVYEGTEGPSSGGRRPMNLYINAENFYVLAIDIGVSDTAYAISDFNGCVLTQGSTPTDGSPADFLNNLADEIQSMIAANYAKARFGAVGVSVPGLVNRENGTVDVSPNLKWQNVPVRKILSERLGLPVLVENDANAAAFSELLYGPLTEAKVRTLLFVLVVEGLGTGLIINGALHVGSNHGLGGFGHMIIDPNGELCSCGRRGCWETFASERATLDRFKRLTAKNGPPIANIAELVGLAKKGNKCALQSLKITGEYLGEGISNLAHGLLPETVVIGGDITDAWEIIGPVIKGKLQSRYIISPDSITVRPASVRRPSLYGTIPIALQNCYPSSQNSFG